MSAIQEPTNRDIQQSVDRLGTKVDGNAESIRLLGEKVDILAQSTAKGFEDVYKRFDGVEGRIDRVEVRLDGVENHLDKIEKSVSTVEGTSNTQMVTKSYLDDKLANLYSDIVAHMQRERYSSMEVLLDELLQSKVISKTAAQRVLHYHRQVKK